MCLQSIVHERIWSSCGSYIRAFEPGVADVAVASAAVCGRVRIERSVSEEENKEKVGISRVFRLEGRKKETRYARDERTGGWMDRSGGWVSTSRDGGR